MYSEALKLPELKYIFLTRVKSKNNDIIDCDTFIPEIPVNLFRLASKDEMNEYVGNLNELNTVTVENGFVLEFKHFKKV